MADIVKEIKAEEQKIEHSVESGFNKAAKNPWMMISAVLGIVLLASVFFLFKGGVTGNTISADDAGKKVVDFVSTRFGADVSTYENVTDLGDLYQVTIPYQGQKIPVYISKDGQYFISSAIEMAATPANPSASASNTDTAAAASVEKSDKPVVDGYFFSYCPYGLQFEKAMIPVYNLLKDKADINIVAIGAMHGEYERVESLRQICVEKEYGKDKLWAYLEQFALDTTIGSCRGTASCVDPLLEKLMANLSIDKDKIAKCMASDAPALYDAQVAKANSMGISGSPTFVINGAQVQVSRSADAIKKAVCDAFTTAPSECSQTLSSTAASPGFGAGAGSASSGSAGGCGV